jgi:hypothetical protein
MRKLVYPLFIVLFLFSCGKKNRPGETIIEHDDIEVHWYKEATITSCYEIVDVKKGDSSVQVLKLNCGLGIADISINEKEIVIKSLPRFFFLDYKKNVFNYTIRLDSTISQQYYYQKAFERDREIK